MDAVITAGGIPLPEDKLYPYTNGENKALVEIAGKPMIQWMLDAFGEAQHIENVVVVGLSAKSGLTCKKPLHFVPGRGRMLANMVAGGEKVLELNPKTEHFIIASSDIPGLRAPMIDWLVENVQAHPADLIYGVITRAVMEARYPQSRRTYLKFKDVELCGADISAAHIRMITEHLNLWEELIGRRKNPLQQAATIGWDIVFKLVFRQITLDELVALVSARLGISARAVVWDYAEVGMDVDKPHQLEMMRADLGGK